MFVLSISVLGQLQVIGLIIHIHNTSNSLTRPWYAELSVLQSQVVQQGGKHQTQIVADSTERGWPQRIHISNSPTLRAWGSGGVGGSGLNC